MRRMMVAGNWKMHGSVSFTETLLADLLAAEETFPLVDALVAPTFVHLSLANAQLQTSKIALGAQNMSAHDQGAFTGEVAGQMLTDVGCQYAIVGHSERREQFGETDQLVAEKALAAQRAGLTPIVCVGETLAEREQGSTLAIISRQLQAVLASDGVDLGNIVIAYEPVWAIGTGVTATPEEAQQVHAAIRAMVSERDAEVARLVVILYGGSVKPSNAAALFAGEDIDGALVGGASLDASQFIQICQTAQACQE